MGASLRVPPNPAVSANRDFPGDQSDPTMAEPALEPAADKAVVRESFPRGIGHGQLEYGFG